MTNAVDPSGKELQIVGDADDKETATNDIESLVPESLRDRISVDASGSVSFDTKGLDSKTLEMAGVTLLLNMINSSLVYNYSVSHKIEIQFSTDGGKTYFRALDLLDQKTFEQLPDGYRKAILNLTQNNAETSADKNPTAKPKEGVDALVRILPGSFSGTDLSGGKKVMGYERSVLVFHELHESFQKAEYGIPYHAPAPPFEGAHFSTIRAEKQFIQQMWSQLVWNVHNQLPGTWSGIIVNDAAFR